MNKRNIWNILLAIVCLFIVGCPIAVPSYATSGTISDPTYVGVGARSLGMGRTYVGVAEDANAVFMNPAGLGKISNPKFSSMYSSLMGDVTYGVLGGAYPYGEKGAIGAGIINSGVSDIMLTNNDGSPAGTGNWGTSVLVLSGGAPFKNLLPSISNLNRDLMVGGSLKYFSTGGLGQNNVVDIANAAGSGYSVDLGLLYPATEYLTLGLDYQNLLSGSISRTSGVTDTIPQTIKVGGNFCLIGRDGQGYTVHKSRKLYLNADYDYNPGPRPNPLHVGLEFWPNPNFALRTGSDDGDLTAGVGLRVAGVEFNYAYHPYHGIGDDATHFFSIDYLGESNPRILRVTLDSPNDKAVIYADHVKVAGKVEIVEGDESAPPAGALTVKVNGINMPVAEDKTFSAEVPVDAYGKKLLLVEVSDTAGDSTSQEFRIVRLTSFADVPEGYWAKMPIENTATVGLIQGYPDGTFKPDNTLTRAELSTMLVRAKGLAVPEGRAHKIFKDVSPDFWAAKYIEVAQRAGLVKGYPDKTFRPNNKISKAEGIAVLVRFDNLKVAEAVYEKPYWDISAKHWAAKYIQAAKDNGMLKFVERNKLRPKEGLARSEAVEMFAKTSLADVKIKDLYSWEKGFRKDFLYPEKPKTRASL